MKELICARAACLARVVGLLHHASAATSAANSAMMVTTTSISISVTPACASSFLSWYISFYTATSLMLVIASSMLRINAPTIMPITRITSGSNSEVKRLMAARVSVS